MLKEFKEFILKGNAIDMAVGVLIGAAFGSVVKAIGDGIIHPLIRAMGGNHNFALKLGIFDLGLVINALTSLVITGLILFYVIVKPVRSLQNLKKEEPAPETPPEPSSEEKLLTEIRDLLRAQKS